MISHSARETIEYAQKFARRLNGGEVIGLVGDLGSGKTIFVQGLAKALGVKENITSPTFVILKVYKIPKKSIHPFIYLSIHPLFFVHVDAYRIEKAEDAESVGLSDYLGRKDAIIVIEWADKIKKILPKSAIYIEFEHLGHFGENFRKVSIRKY